MSRFVSFAFVLSFSGLAMAAHAQTGDLLTDASTPRQSASRPTFQASVDLVALTVTVTDTSNQYVRNLAPNDFTVLEDGVAQPVSFFGLSDVPLDLALLIDASASMQPQMPMVRQAAAGLLGTLKAGDRAALVEFRDQIAVEEPMTEDLGRVDRGPGSDQRAWRHVALQRDLRHAPRLREDGGGSGHDQAPRDRRPVRRRRHG